MPRSAILPCIVLAGAVVAAPPAGATGTAESAVVQAASAWTVVAGNFTGDARDESFWYTPGATPDVLVSSSNGGTVDGDLEEDVFEFEVDKTYRPFTGDFDGEGRDDIAWYAPGPAADTTWDFTYGTRNFTSRALEVNGSYRPIALDALGDGPRGTDLWFYAPGSAPDPFWEIRLGVKDSEHNLPLGGNWQVAVGDFLGDGREDAYVSNSNVGYTLRNFTEEGGENVWVDYNYRFSSAQAVGSGGSGPPLGPIEGDGPYVIGTMPPQTPDTP
jgi:hypothetical protein